jgi:hypothetical protein
MTHALPWHSTLATDRPLFHDDTRCPEGGATTVKDRSAFRRCERDPCPHCAGLLVETIGTRLRRPVLPESDVHRCPACHSERIARGEHLIVADGVVVRREYQCAACEGAFWVRADGAQPNAPSDAVWTDAV